MEMSWTDRKWLRLTKRWKYENMGMNEEIMHNLKIIKKIKTKKRKDKKEKENITKEKWKERLRKKKLNKNREILSLKHDIRIASNRHCPLSNSLTLTVVGNQRNYNQLKNSKKLSDSEFRITWNSLWGINYN